MVAVGGRSSALCKCERPARGAAQTEGVLTSAQLREFGERGYIVVPQVVGEAWLPTADAEIDRVVAASPPAPDQFAHQSLFLPPAELPAALAALTESGALAVAVELTAPEPPDQVAPDSFTLLAGIFLSDESEPDSGAVWVWPGSHLVHEALFRERGADALMETGGHITMLRDAPPLGPS